MVDYLNNPMMQSAYYRQPTNSLIRVTGIDGARAYQMAPNSTVALFDNNTDYMYIKSTDGAGFPTIRTFSFTEVKEQKVDANNFVTRDEFEQLRQEILNYGKQSVSANNQSKSTNNKSGKTNDVQHQ